ncbi:MCE family protein [Kibdelosporangium phytohabitans]|uniref:ABC transporter substrate-binding protein n=1 Tax=Kibdelosporangium phytohabitans TaxID=860235 RepID=A0A0N7F4M9_9PSEU|nr:MlaD family protein [Kibdelosporangium phytohabitans]ALG11879.1 ABC transporter substrate-binding protein [Kibdelosporangium phytohabitans]MBE1463318.1 phospholipid/cholesterol/gamma-HCH transport system substrate-binding protein [Kibdelosporangium phytohabitans]
MRWALVKGAVFVVLTLAATALLGITIANQGGGDTVSYRARFTDVTSVNPGDDIRISGVRVGQVDDVHVVDQRVGEVAFSVASDRALTSTTTATIKFRNLIGQRYVSLELGTGTDALAPDALIPLDRTRPALDLTAMLNGFRPLFQALSPQDVNQLSMEIIQVLQGEGGTVDSLLGHTASLTKALADKDRVIGEVITNLNTVLDQVNGRGDKLSSLVTTTQDLVSGLARDAKPIGEAVDGLAALTTATGDLLRDGREPLRKDIAQLGRLSQVLADNSPTFEAFISNLPAKYEAIGRTASYGSWLNFFLCSAVSDAPQAPGGPPVGVPNTEARCRG